VSRVLVDTNVIIDVASGGSAWSAWSARELKLAIDIRAAVINPIIYAELSIGYQTSEELDRLLVAGGYAREDLPWEAAFTAGRCFVEYRRRGGLRTSPLPDFYIGAHALARKYRLLTRDTRRYRTYFPTLELICPPEA
jgi:predicted nucleic acid-binding protein